MSGLYTMMTLGGFQFGVATAAYQELRRSTEYHWPSQPRFGGAPAVQFVGAGDDTISLPGVIYPEFNGGTGQLDALRALADTKRPLLMIDGRGNVLGNWVIERVEEGQETFAQAGVARKQAFVLSLKKYGDLDAAAGMGLLDKLPISAAISQLPAVSASLSAASNPADILKTVTGTAQAAFSAATRLSGGISAALTNVSRVAASLGVHAPAITAALTRSQDVANGIRTVANGGLALMGRVQTAASAGSAARSMFDSSTTQTQLARGSSATIKSSLASLTTDGAPADTLATITSAMVSANKVTALSSALTDTTNAIIKKISA